MKIKTFKFEVSNSGRTPISNDSTSAWFREQRQKLMTPEEIDEEINSFCCDKMVVDIKVSTVDAHYHNNARDNTIELWYTIMYKEETK